MRYKTLLGLFAILFLINFISAININTYNAYDGSENGIYNLIDGSYLDVQTDNDIPYVLGSVNGGGTQDDLDAWLNLSYDLSSEKISDIDKLIINISYCHSSDISTPYTCIPLSAGDYIFNNGSLRIYNFNTGLYDYFENLPLQDGIEQNLVFSYEGNNWSDYISGTGEMIISPYVNISIITNGVDASINIDLLDITIESSPLDLVIKAPRQAGIYPSTTIPIEVQGNSLTLCKYSIDGGPYITFNCNGDDILVGADGEYIVEITATDGVYNEYEFIDFTVDSTLTSGRSLLLVGLMILLMLISFSMIFISFKFNENLTFLSVFFFVFGLILMVSSVFLAYITIRQFMGTNGIFSLWTKIFIGIMIAFGGIAIIGMITLLVNVLGVFRNIQDQFERRNNSDGYSDMNDSKIDFNHRMKFSNDGYGYR